MAARARAAPLGRSRCPLEPARRRWGARNGRSNSLGSARALETAQSGWSKHYTCRRFRVRARSAPLGPAGTLEMAARTRSASPGRSKWPLELARLRQGDRNCSAWLLEKTAPADVSEFEPARLRWGARHWRSSPLCSAGAPEIAARARSAPLDRGRTTNACCARHRDEHSRAWNARVRTYLLLVTCSRILI